MDFTTSRQARLRPASGPAPSMRGRRAGVIVALLACASVLAGACGKSKLDPKQCTTLRGQAFAIVNEASKCKTDQDCLVTSWPGCAHEADQDMLDRIKPL